MFKEFDTLIMRSPTDAGSTRVDHSKFLRALPGSHVRTVMENVYTKGGVALPGGLPLTPPAVESAIVGYYANRNLLFSLPVGETSTENGQSTMIRNAVLEDEVEVMFRNKELTAHNPRKIIHTSKKAFIEQGKRTSDTVQVAFSIGPQGELMQYPIDGTSQEAEVVLTVDRAVKVREAEFIYPPDYGLVEMHEGFRENPAHYQVALIASLMRQNLVTNNGSGAGTLDIALSYSSPKYPKSTFLQAGGPVIELIKSAVASEISKKR